MLGKDLGAERGAGWGVTVPLTDGVRAEARG